MSCRPSCACKASMTSIRCATRGWKATATSASSSADSALRIANVHRVAHAFHALDIARELQCTLPCLGCFDETAQLDRAAERIDFDPMRLGDGIVDTFREIGRAHV